MPGCTGGCGYTWSHHRYQDHQKNIVYNLLSGVGQFDSSIVSSIDLNSKAKICWQINYRWVDCWSITLKTHGEHYQWHHRETRVCELPFDVRCFFAIWLVLVFLWICLLRLRGRECSDIRRCPMGAVVPSVFVSRPRITSRFQISIFVSKYRPCPPVNYWWGSGRHWNVYWPRSSTGHIVLTWMLRLV